MLSSIKISHLGEGGHIGIVTFESWNIPNNAVMPEVGKGPSLHPLFSLPPLVHLMKKYKLVTYTEV